MPPDNSPDLPPPLYVSCVDGKPVTRYRLGERGGRPGDAIGTTRGEGRTIVYRPDDIIMIPPAEVAAFGRIYLRAIKDRHLVQRTREEYDAFVATQKARKNAADAEASATAASNEAEAGTAPANEPASPAGGNVS